MAASIWVPEIWLRDFSFIVYVLGQEHQVVKYQAIWFLSSVKYLYIGCRSALILFSLKLEKWKANFTEGLRIHEWSIHRYRGSKMMSMVCAAVPHPHCQIASLIYPVCSPSLTLPGKSLGGIMKNNLLPVYCIGWFIESLHLHVRACVEFGFDVFYSA